MLETVTNHKILTIVDVKSTGLFKNDDVLKAINVKQFIGRQTPHIKRKVNIEKALAGFEKSNAFLIIH